VGKVNRFISYMSFRKFTADYLFNGYHIISDSVLITTEHGMVVDIVPREDAGNDIQIFEGILVPGLINCHCHIELSHLKNIIPPHTGLIDFLVSVVKKRGFEDDIIQQAIIGAEAEMYNNGIVAVGDICNTLDAIKVKSKSKIFWRSFIEVLNFTDEKAENRMEYYTNILYQHQNQLTPGNRNALSPHAPYTISPKTFQLINLATKNQIISIHNQEHSAEDELYKTGGGEFLNFLKTFGMDHSPYPVTGKSSIQSYLPYFTNGQTIFLVHNTFTSEDDIIFATEYAHNKDLTLVYCLCINANKYIEDIAPPIELFVNNNCHLVLGTDSYSSNWQLNIVKEIEALLNTSYFINMPFIEALETVLKWATMNGARALQLDDVLGSFEKGKQPGVVLIENIGERNFNSKRIL